MRGHPAPLTRSSGCGVVGSAQRGLCEPGAGEALLIGRRVFGVGGRACGRLDPGTTNEAIDQVAFGFLDDVQSSKLRAWASRSPSV